VESEIVMARKDTVIARKGAKARRKPGLSIVIARKDAKAQRKTRTEANFAPLRLCVNIPEAQR
jgi:hypothetical protein